MANTGKLFLLYEGYRMNLKNSVIITLSRRFRVYAFMYKKETKMFQMWYRNVDNIWEDGVFTVTLSELSEDEILELFEQL